MAHIAEILHHSPYWVPLAVLGASLTGSAHCVSMCGGLVASVARSRTAWIGYQLGRLAGYLALGALAGALGSAMLASDAAVPRWLSAAATLLIGVGFITAGMRVWQGKPPHVSILPERAVAALFKLGQTSSALTGIFSAFLPCGWLHLFILGAVATQSARLGAGFLLMFWLGTLPALAATPWLVQRVFKPLSRRSPRLVGLALIVVGILSVGFKLVHAPTANESCHEEKVSWPSY